jgi:hypothetical protein
MSNSLTPMTPQDNDLSTTVDTHVENIRHTLQDEHAISQEAADQLKVFVQWLVAKERHAAAEVMRERCRLIAEEEMDGYTKQSITGATTMQEYHKIQTVFKRDMATKHKTLIDGAWTLPEFEYLASNQWTFTEKVDGTNIRVMFSDGKITFGGKTDNAQIPALLVARLNERFLPLVHTMSEVFNAPVCLYGEGYGAKIQKGGGNYRPDQDFVLFDVLIGEWWLQREDVEDVAHRLDLEVVPIIGQGTLYEMVYAAQRGIRSQWGNFEAEGIVARPTTELKARNGSRIITKIKCKDFAKS